ncbi:MAG: hypothetical protein LBR26_03215 [Prevotella sp.]|jgi:hypothetical protein|nr:hypothetical protein [Prevotella sp.]
MATKEKEINALKALVKMDGYFAEYFKGDLETMINNINNDFPIEMGIKCTNTIEYFQKRGDDLAVKHANEIIDLVDTLLCVHEETGDERLYERAVEKLGMKNVIARKRIFGLTITNAEIDFLLK